MPPQIVLKGNLQPPPQLVTTNLPDVLLPSESVHSIGLSGSGISTEGTFHVGCLEPASIRIGLSCLSVSILDSSQLIIPLNRFNTRITSLSLLYLYKVLL